MSHFRSSALIENIELKVKYVLAANKDDLRSPILKEQFFEKDTSHKVAEYRITHTLHSYSRAANRGFTAADILRVLDFGVRIYKQGYIFHYIIRKYVPSSVDSKVLERISNMVVVTDSNEEVIITCYKSRDAARHIRRKSKVKK
jgi:hypothetical protein